MSDQIEASESTTSTVPMRFPTSFCPVDVDVVEVRCVTVRFRSPADRRVFGLLPADERAELRRAFEMQVRDLSERGA